MEDDSWDNIDYDKKISEMQQAQKDAEAVKPVNFEFDEENSSRYYPVKSSYDKREKKQSTSATSSSQNNFEYLPFSHKELLSMRQDNLDKMFYSTYGNWMRLIVTHEQEKLSDESLVELLKIDVFLLNIPFRTHNSMLLEALSQIKSFWHQLINVLENFFEVNYKNPKYCLLIDIRGLMEHLISLICWLNIQGSQDEMFEIFQLLVTTMKKYSDRDYYNLHDFDLNVFDEISKDLKIFDIYPHISDLKHSPENLEKNLVDVEYENVMHYLHIQLPLLKEDYMCKLRSGCNFLQKAELTGYIRTPDANIYPKSRIHLKWQNVWNTSCPTILVSLNTSARHFFNGQLVIFTSDRDINDLIVATILRNPQIDELNDDNTAAIEIIRMENISDIFDRDLIMLEAKSFFDPYLQVFTAMKSLNEFNFPFKNRIVNVHKECNFPGYQHSNLYTYKNHSIRPDTLDEWKKYDLGLESMQVEAVHSAISNDFSLIVGPPGSGKTFLGLEIMKILLENTNEKILVLTQTNNALDKFLLGCLDFTKDIVRLGGQCQNEALLPYLADNIFQPDAKNYLKKLHYMQRTKVNELIANNASEVEIFKQISKHYRLTEEVNQLRTFCNINSKRIYGMTTSFSAHNSSINKMLRPGIVIIEEASEILESHVVASLTKDTKHVIMIGDHQQLRPQTNSYELQKKFNFNVSLFERLIKSKVQHVSLDVQMRMRPEFCDLVRETVYFNLKDGDNVLKYPNVRGVRKNFLCFSHNYPESSAETSKFNQFEVDFVIQIYEKLVNCGNDPKDIVILTSYAAQAKRFKEKLKNSHLPFVRVAILDAYQGEESNIVLLSLVRSNKDNDIGFLSFENRVSVILSRAKIGFYICGNMQCFAASSKMWRQVVKVLVRHNALEDDLTLDNI